MQAVHERNPERRLTVMTPEQVELRFETAGIGSRAGAQLIDGLIILAVNAGIALAGWAVAEAIGDAMPDWLAEYGAAAMIIFYAAFNALYFIIAEYTTGGRTIGKRAMGIRVIQENGRTLSFLSSVIRNLFRLIDMLPALYFIGILFSFFHPKDKRIGDWAASTVVVFERGSGKRQRKRIEKLLKDKQPLMPQFTFEPWVRDRVSEQEWSLLSGFVERLRTLAPKRAAELAAGIVELLAPKLDLADRWNELREPSEDGTAAVPTSQAANVQTQRAAQKRKMLDDQAVLWALAIYSALRDDWELARIGESR